MSVENIRKVKLLVLGDSGVGKTSFVHLIAHGEVLSNPSSTVGCTVEVKLHEYTRSLSSTPTSFFVEFWDVGGALSHEKGRSIFYNQTDGVVLVHDLTNRKSRNSLNDWLEGFHQSAAGGKGRHKGSDRSSDYDPEQFAEQHVPMMIVGTKEDQLGSRRSPQSPHSRSAMMGALTMAVNCTNSRQFALDSIQLIELNSFIDKVIEHKFYPSLHSSLSSSSSREKTGTLSKRHSLNSYKSSSSSTSSLH